MYLASRGSKNYHRQLQQEQQTRGNANGNNKHLAGNSPSKTLKQNKRRFRNGFVTVILFVCLLWIYVTHAFIRNVSKSSSSEVHSIAQSQQHLRNVVGKSSMKKISKPTNNKNQSSSQAYTIAHSLTTRFMLGQKGQPILARARYLLFETFCQPTVRFQTTENFSWFVLADPGLDQEILNDLQALLSKEHFPNENAYLILTDNPSWAADGVGVPGVTSYGAGLEEIARGVRDESVRLLTGDSRRLVRILEEKIESKPKKPLLLIETMLDADDGLNNQAMEWIQDLAVSHTQQQQQLQQESIPTLNSTWWLLCGTDHIEWHNRDIYRLTAKQFQQKGLSAGIIGQRHAPQYCASAGFTRVGLTLKVSPREGPLLVFPQIAYSNHALATEKFDRCSEGSEDGIRKRNNTTIPLWSKCFRRDFEGSRFVLKGRTVTSDSMDHMGVRNEDYRDLPWESKDEHPLLGLDDQDEMWGIAATEFSIDRVAAQTTSLYLREHLESILSENKESRCAPGFPCREVADAAFKKMTKYIHALIKVNKRQAKGKSSR